MCRVTDCGIRICVVFIGGLRRFIKGSFIARGRRKGSRRGCVTYVGLFRITGATNGLRIVVGLITSAN
jgi:hypothetical protein